MRAFDPIGEQSWETEELLRQCFEAVMGCNEQTRSRYAVAAAMTEESSTALLWPESLVVGGTKVKVGS